MDIKWKRCCEKEFSQGGKIKSKFKVQKSKTYSMMQAHKFSFSVVSEPFSYLVCIFLVGALDTLQTVNEMYSYTVCRAVVKVKKLEQVDFLSSQNMLSLHKTKCCN